MLSVLVLLAHVLRKQTVNFDCVVLLVTDCDTDISDIVHILNLMNYTYAVGHLHTNHALGHAVTLTI